MLVVPCPDWLQMLEHLLKEPELKHKIIGLFNFYDIFMTFCHLIQYLFYI